MIVHFWDISNLLNFGVKLQLHTTANPQISHNKLNKLKIFFALSQKNRPLIWNQEAHHQ
jgi:hypothetical protein